MASARRSVALVALAMTVAACGGSSSDIRLGVQPTQADVVERASLTFAVSVSGSFSEDVDWELEGTGSLDPATGVYTAPDQVPAPAKNFAIVRARSRVDSRVFAEASVRIIPPPFIPRRGPVTGGTSVVLEGEGFGAGTEVFFGENVAAVDVLSPNLLRAVAPPSTIGIAPLDVRVIASPGGAEEIYPLAYHYAATTLRFPGAVQVPTCDGQDLTIADIDGDGDLDIATGCLTLQRILVLRNDGTGFLAKEDVLTEGINPMELVFGDPDGDGVPDLAVLENDRIEIFANDGNGVFTHSDRILLPPGSNGIENRVVFADVNADGYDDIAYNNFATDRVGIALSLGPFGGFAVPTFVTTQDAPRDLVVADVIGDANLDLVVCGSTNIAGTPGIEVIPGTGGGMFGARRGYPTATLTAALALADANGDGKDDLFVGTALNGRSVLLATNGGFAAATLFSGTNAASRELRAGDVDGDLYEDVLTRTSSTRGVRIHWGSAAGTMLTNTLYDAVQVPERAVIAHIDSGGLPDLVTTGPDMVEVYSQYAPRQFGPPVYDVQGSPGLAAPGPRGVARLSDGRIATVLENGSASNRGAIGFSPEELAGASTSLPLPAGSAPVAIWAGDVFGDGSEGILLADSGADSGGDGAVWVLHLNTAGSFGPTRISFGREVLRAIALRTSHARPDLYVSVREASGAALYRVPASGELGFSSFAQSERLDAGARPDRLLAADFDGDGLDDLIASDSLGGQLTLFPTGESAPIILQTGDFPGPVKIHDLDRDGLPDLLVTSRVLTTTAQVEVFLALAPGVFGAPESYAFNGNPVDMTLSDVDGDDLLDVIVATQGPDAIVVLRGRDEGELGRAEPVPIGGDVRALVARSTDGGLPDVIVVDGGSRGVRVLRNRSE